MEGCTRGGTRSPRDGRRGPGVGAGTVQATPWTSTSAGQGAEEVGPVLTARDALAANISGVGTWAEPATLLKSYSRHLPTC